MNESMVNQDHMVSIANLAKTLKPTVDRLTELRAAKEVLSAEERQIKAQHKDELDSLISLMKYTNMKETHNGIRLISFWKSEYLTTRKGQQT